MTSHLNERILIADNHPDDVQLLSRCLDDLGFEPIVAKSVEDIFAGAIVENPPSLILMAETIFGQSGYDVCRQLKNDVTTQNILVMFIISTAQAVEFVFEAGAIDYLLKPIQATELLARITTHLSLRTLQEDLMAQNAELEQENVLRQALETALHRSNMALAEKLEYQQAELVTIRSTLEDEVSERQRAETENRKFSKTLKENENLITYLEQLKDEFLTNTSHELRSPLNGIIGISKSMIDGATGSLSPDQLYNLSMILSSGRHLSDLINDILDFSMLKHHELKLDLRPVDIRAVADVVLSEAQTLIEEKALQLTNDIPLDLPLINGDEQRIHQILGTLIGNAIKFTDRGGVTISARARRDGMAIITISDTGIGIRADKLHTIFQSFEHVASLEQGGGTGLGLSIVKQLVELHGGTIEVESVEGKGSYFTFSVPLYKGRLIDTSPEDGIVATPATNDQLIQMSSQELSANSAYTILVVDDELINVQVLTNYLGLQNYAVAQAFDGQEAMDAFEEVRPDLVLLDVMMPRMSGYEVCRKMREQRPAHELPIILLAAKNQMSDMLAGFEAGANDYLTKPFDKNELLTRIKTYLQLSKINQAYGRFVPQEFLQFLGKETILDVELGDQVQRHMTILFSDIRSFTTLSESMTPQENFNFLNSYLSQVSPIIRKYRGFVDKYIGDALMALFPESVDDAVQAAISMQQAVNVYNGHRAKQGYRPIEIGVGIHAGNLMLGTIGEERRMENTVISDTVNLASRIEGLTKLYGASIVVSEEVLFKLNQLTRYHFRFLDKVKVKGKQVSISVFEIFDGHPEETINLKLDTRTDFEKGLLHYHSQEFAEATTYFERVVTMDATDQAAWLYLKRTKHFIEYGVPPGWDGIESLNEK